MQEFDYWAKPPGAPKGGLERVLKVLHLPDASRVVWAVRVGSHVYGTATPDSDEDFFVVINGGPERGTVIKERGIDVIVRSMEGFQRSLDEQNVFTLECLFTPVEHTLVRGPQHFKWKLDRVRLVESALEKSDSDWNKAIRGDESGMTPKARKQLVHSIRVPLFAVQILQNHTITDFGAAREVHDEVMTDPSDDPAHYASTYGPMRSEVLQKLSLPRR